MHGTESSVTVCVSLQIVDPISKITSISDLLSYKGCLLVKRPCILGGKRKKKKLLLKNRIPPFHTTRGRRYDKSRIVLTNQMLVYKHRQVIVRTASSRIPQINKTVKVNPRINLRKSSDLGIAIPRFILRC